MKRRETTALRSSQQGFALILMVMVFIIGVTWYGLGALGKAAMQGYERDQVTAAALKKAKEALLAYLVTTAAMTTDTADSRQSNPGRLPCPESLSHPGTTNEGVAADLVAGYTSCGSAGRLPWKSLGVDQIRDGYGEPLWYAVATGTWAKALNTTTLTINPGLANQLTYDGTPSAVVAVIIAPGAGLNTTGESGTPSGTCNGFATVNQLTSTRNTVPLAAANFLECGNATGANYTTIGTSPWSNDRTISITANEVMDAISGAVADRLQRQVAPALQDWYTAQSTAWGLGRSFFPYASAFNTVPASNGLCGPSASPFTASNNEGVLPAATTAAGTCNTAWSGGALSQISTLTFWDLGCSYTGSAMQCIFGGLNLSLLGSLFRTRVTANASRILSSFRAPIAATDITITPLISSVPASVANFSISLDATTGIASLSFEVSTTLNNGIFEFYLVNVPNPPNAAVLTDSRMTWYVNNGWPRYTYYQMSSAANANPTGTCPLAGGAQCLSITNFPTDYGSPDNKRFVLTLLGKPVTGQTQPSANSTDYLESKVDTTTYIFNSAASTSNTYKVVDSTFNDRHATCPFKFTSTSPSICD